MSHSTKQQRRPPEARNLSTPVLLNKVRNKGTLFFTHCDRNIVYQFPVWCSYAADVPARTLINLPVGRQVTSSSAEVRWLVEMCTSEPTQWTTAATKTSWIARLEASITSSSPLSCHVVEWAGHHSAFRIFNLYHTNYLHVAVLRQPEYDGTPCRCEENSGSLI